MKISKLPLLAAILPLAATLFLVPAQVHADTYKLFDLGNDNGFSIVGIDTAGDVVIFDAELTFEYLTYSNGVLVNTTSTLPSLTYDNGTHRAASRPASQVQPVRSSAITDGLALAAVSIPTGTRAEYIPVPSPPSPFSTSQGRPIWRC